MKFLSTRNSSLKVDFKTAILQGLAPDGGLFCPELFPDLSGLFSSYDRTTPFNTIAKDVFSSLIDDELEKKITDRIIDRAFTFTPKIKTLNDGLHILELFHGPSHAFKDFGASFLASAMEEFLQEDNKKALILTATSGDTGSAVAQAFYKRNNISVVILYPSGRVSPLQEKQLTTLGENIVALEIKGSFDDCQRMVKEAFTNQDLINKLPLSSANSINLGRLIPQSFYYIWGRLQIPENPFYFVVPSGNFGNLTAGLYAKFWGLPVTGFVAATNANDVVPGYLKSGFYQPRPSQATLSNAMDVGDPSNFERMKHLFKNDLTRFNELLYGDSITDEETLSAIKSTSENDDYYICPHTAVGCIAARSFRKTHPNGEIMVLSTAHPAKFIEVVEKATGETPELPDNLARLMNLTKKSVIMEPEVTALSKYLLSHYS